MDYLNWYLICRLNLIYIVSEFSKVTLPVYTRLKYEREVLAVKADLEFTVTEYDLWVIFRERKKGLTTTMLG